MLSEKVGTNENTKGNNRKDSFFSKPNIAGCESTEFNAYRVEKEKLKTAEDQNKYAVATVNLEKKIQSFIDEEFPSLRSGPTKRISMDSNSYNRGLNDGINCNIAKGGIGNKTIGQLA